MTVDRFISLNKFVNINYIHLKNNLDLKCQWKKTRNMASTNVYLKKRPCYQFWEVGHVFTQKFSGWYVFEAHRKEGKSNQIKDHSGN